jgi:hypothetical protein
MIFLDLGTNMFQGLEEFTDKIKLNNNSVVYCFEANTEGIPLPSLGGF